MGEQTAKRQDIGFKAVEELAALWQIDDDRIIWHPDGFEWWPGHFRQVIRVSEGIEAQGRVNYQLSATTDFITDVDGENAFLPIYLHGLQKGTSSYAIKMIPEEARRQWDINEIESDISLVSQVYIREDNIGWMPRFFGGMAILQLNDAQVRAEGFAVELNARAKTSAPDNGALRDLDEILLVVRDIYIPAGREPSRWLDSGEFEDIAAQFGRLEHCFGNGDGGGLSLEVPFGSDTALIQLSTNQPHPQLGNGLLATLKLPVWIDDPMSMDPNWYNLLELSSLTYVPLIGSWCTYPMNDEQSVIAFSSFIPNLLYQPSLATNMALWMMGRAGWTRSTHYPDLIDTPLQDTLRKRYEGMQGR